LHYLADSYRNGGMMLGYTKEDLDEMTNAIESALTTINPDDDPWLSGNLNMTLVFLQGLWAEGYFD
jgi:hypothetical protein